MRKPGCGAAGGLRCAYSKLGALDVPLLVLIFPPIMGDMGFKPKEVR